MILARSVDPRWLSNSWLVAGAPGGPAAVIDAGAPPEPLLLAAREHRLKVAIVVLTHHHGDHACERAAYAPAPCAMHALDRVHLPGIARDVADGEEIGVGELTLTALHVPGHTRGQLNVLVRKQGETPRLFSGDTLFRGSVGGTRAPGHGTFAELRRSLLERLLALPDETIVHPGHGDDTTIGRERAANPFLVAWREPSPPGEPCTALGRPATLLLWAPDYDGGFKAWVRWEDGSEDVVPGSRVER